MSNSEIIRHQIAQKAYSSSPYFPPTDDIFRVTTDINQFPYQRFFRGRPDSYRPIIWEREAGYHRIQTDTTVPQQTSEINPTEMCFQTPCSTVLPCTNKTGNAFPMQQRCVYLSP